MECVSLVDGGWLFDKNLNQWTSINILAYKEWGSYWGKSLLKQS